MLSVPEQISHTRANQVTLGFLSQPKQLELQPVKKRFHRDYIPAVLKAIRVFTKKGFRLKDNSPSIEMFSQTRQNWDHFLCKQEGNSRDHILDFFKRKKPGFTTQSKNVQTLDHEVALIGGYVKSLLAQKYDVGRSCIFLDLSSGIIS